MLKSVAITFAVAIACIGVIHASDLILGNITPGDRVLHSQGYASAGLVNQIVSRIVSYNGLYNITAVRAYDRSFNRTGYASLVSGGVGQRNVSINVQGRSYGIGYDYLVEIHGR